MKAKKLIISILALLNVVFVPIFDVWGGLFPGDPDDNFFDAIGYAFEGEFDMWVVIFTLTIFIPSLFMFIFSFTSKNKLFRISSIVGIIGMILLLYLLIKLVITLSI